MLMSYFHNSKNKKKNFKRKGWIIFKIINLLLTNTGAAGSPNAPDHSGPGGQGPSGSDSGARPTGGGERRWPAGPGRGRRGLPAAGGPGSPAEQRPLPPHGSAPTPAAEPEPPGRAHAP